MGMEIIMKARGSLRIHDDNIIYTQTTEIENTLSFQASLTLKFEGFSLGFPGPSFQICLIAGFTNKR